MINIWLITKLIAKITADDPNQYPSFYYSLIMF